MAAETCMFSLHSEICNNKRNKNNIYFQAGIYIRVCSVEEEIRLLRHVLNCPGIGEWGAHVIHFSDTWYEIFRFNYWLLCRFTNTSFNRTYQQAERFYNMLAVFLSSSILSPPTFLIDFGQEFLLAEAEKIKKEILAKSKPKPKEVSGIS